MSLGSASEEKDLNKLLDEVRDFAGDVIGKTGRFPPFGVTVSADGQLGLVIFQDAPGVSGEQLINQLAADVQAEAAKENLRAAGIAYMVSMEIQSQPVSAIVVFVQHRSGKPLEVFLPFKREGKTAQIGQQIT
jgi:hypothetical protein